MKSTHQPINKSNKQLISENKTNEYQKRLKQKMDEYVHFIYRITKDFPKYELYGVTSQIRRASMSVILNYIEGYVRRKPLVRLNFLETLYGSLQESKYLLEFSYVEEYLIQNDHNYGIQLVEEIGAMLWKDLNGIDKFVNSNTK